MLFDSVTSRCVPKAEATCGTGVGTTVPPTTVPGQTTVPGEQTTVPGEQTTVPGEQTTVPVTEAPTPGKKFNGYSWTYLNKFIYFRPQHSSTRVPNCYT